MYLAQNVRCYLSTYMYMCFFFQPIDIHCIRRSRYKNKLTVGTAGLKLDNVIRSEPEMPLLSNNGSFLTLTKHLIIRLAGNHQFLRLTFYNPRGGKSSTVASMAESPAAAIERDRRKVSEQLLQT